MQIPSTGSHTALAMKTLNSYAVPQFTTLMLWTRVRLEYGEIVNTRLHLAHSLHGLWRMVELEDFEKFR
jgi:hypothetical protein